MAGLLMSARVKRLRYVVIGIGVSIGTSSALSQVSSDVKLSFDVAAIKPTGPDQRQRLSIEPGGRFVAEGFSVKTLIGITYGLTTSFQMAGGGGWVETDRWSIQAQADGVTSIPNWSPPHIPEIIAARLRSLLEDRFVLKSHHESRIQQSYTLVESKTGSKLVRTEAPSPSPAESGNPAAKQHAQPPGSIKAGSGVVLGTSTSLDQLVSYLNRLMDRPVIDRTGITGYFNFKLQFAPESAPRYHSPPPSASGSGSEVQEIVRTQDKLLAFRVVQYSEMIPAYMPCPHCRSQKIQILRRKTSLGYAAFRCGRCRRKFNERTGTPFNFLEFPTDIVFQVILFRLRYKLSFRDIAEMFLLRGFPFTHETVRDWEERFASLMAEQLRRKRKGKVGRNWFVDETYLKVKGKSVYLYRAIDRYGNLVDSLLSDKRDMNAARRFFWSAKSVAGRTPEKITTDGHFSYPKAIRDVFGRRTLHRNNWYLNRHIERNHREIKQRYYPMLGFSAFRSAQRFWRAFEEVKQYFRPRSRQNQFVSLSKCRKQFVIRVQQLEQMFQGV